VSPEEGAGYWAGNVYVALATLLDIPLITDIAFTVCV
jgi:hypothetical protein